MQNQPSFGFGAAGAQTTPAAPSGGLFGSQAATPAFGTGAGLFGGTTTTAAPSLFGNTATTGFGTTPTAGLGFGTAPTSFGAQQSTAPALGGAATATPAFGTATATPAFGTATATPAFGTATSLPSFGAPANTTTPTFGSAISATPSFGLTSTAAPTFGATTTTTPSFGLTSSAPTFGTTTTDASALGVTQTAAPAYGTFTLPKTWNTGTGDTVTSTSLSTGAGFNLGATTTSTVSTSSIVTTSTPAGLGGLATTQAKVVTTQKDVTPKDQPLPNELLQTVEAFKGFVKQQKVYSSDIAKCSVRDFRKVEQDINQLMTLLNEVENLLQKNRQLAENLKYDTAKCLKDVEIAQRTQETPPGLQYENVAPLKFFLNLADKFERDMQILKVQIEGADSYVKNYRSPNPLTPQDLALGMRRLHESFVALAGRLHSVHGQVESQKEAYLQMRKQLYNDHSNPFDTHEGSLSHILNYALPKIATGPTPFSSLSLDSTQLFAGQQNQSTMPYSTPTTAAPDFGNVTFGAGQARYPQPLFGSSTLGQSTNSFQLQKPPTGNKRGKQ